MLKILLVLFISAAASAQRADGPRVDSLEGLWQGFDGEWGHVSRQLIALAETIPADKYAWRPGAGVRSTSEVMMHIAGFAVPLSGSRPIVARGQVALSLSD